MSVIVIGRFKANPADLEKVMAERAADFVAVSNEAKGVGGLHHQFGSADGEVIIIDEWDSVDSFQKFFQSNTVIPQIMQDAGVQGAPSSRSTSRWTRPTGSSLQLSIPPGP